MNTRERLLVNRLVARIADAPDASKDSDAEIEVAALVRVRPDAPYLLLQRCLMLETALERTQAQLEPPHAATFAAGIAPTTAPTPVRAPLAVPPSPTAGGAGGFLKDAATIGAGALGGGLLFEGIGSLLHGGPGRGGTQDLLDSGFDTVDSESGT